ncbi:zinc-binding alcohol dehydrogenase family protein [Corynebacterium uberis]|uniref:zinc-binding alcohol dehydrogenase family protein n=1 Tax=Corynebacterium TaxID=1716 RepID=UPI001D0A9BC5|nr:MULTISPECIES: zinc-binding alcohol dehydrogenase family protein [Corynebacterium]MCZ9308794.1 zinc-binding alcohol dehydrogenase family protein [Corynebacterium sp. c6VSa_13]UDL72678.1 zinc-binding alcohol dehydrogenase family protein [Corynebacterium uberis]UDL76446.1 zinc-binding alcohol dehydrogenase family protein [Corynebacterium uberis]UDL78658.1 zinc-binding alcohol dehydrogenase family protein [Corynebacterium uberis]UDL80937.1 zinc-binding alcohol dehydrogenase family protein [Cory
MKAVAILDSLPTSDPDCFHEVELPDPTPRDHDLVVKVHAVSINPIDAKVRRRSGPQDSPKVLGFDAVGTVVARGSKARFFDCGDRVFYSGDITRQGSNAELQLIDERLAARAPRSLSDAAAATVPLTALTAWECLFDRLCIPTDQPHGRLLILGGAGGVPTLALGLARALTQLPHVVATASRPESHEWVRERGATAVIDHSRRLDEQLDAHSVDWVLSTHTSGRAAELAAIMAPQSHLVLIDDPTDFDLAAFKQKSIAVHWESMFTRSMFATPDLARQGEILGRVSSLLDAATLTAPVTRTLEGLSARTLREAHRLIEEDRTVGKIAIDFGAGV